MRGLLGPGFARRSDNILVELRQFYVAYSVLVLIIGGVVPFLGLDGSAESVDLRTALAGVVLLGIGGLALARVVSRPLDCSSRAALAKSFQQRGFLRLSFALSPAANGFAACFLTYRPWPYFVGAAISAVALAGLVPTRGRVARDQAQLDLRGCLVDLVTALRAPETDADGAGDAVRR